LATNANLVEQLNDVVKGQKTQAFLSDGVNDVLFNVTKSTSEGDSNQVTQHAIEKGADVTDNVIQSPKSFSFTAILSDNDIRLSNPRGFFEDSIEDRKQTIDTWLDEKTLLTYYGHETDFENVVIESINRSKDSSVGEGLSLDMSIRQLNIVEATTVDIDLPQITKKGKTAKKTATNGGTRSTEAVKSKSWLKSLFS